MLKGSLYKELIQFSRILIYGAGRYGNKAYEFLESAGLAERIDSFVVSVLNECRDLDGIPIRCIDDVIFNDDSVVLIAVNKTYEEEIVQILQKRKCFHFFRIGDFFIEDDKFHNMLRTQSDERFVESIMDVMWEYGNKEKGIGNCTVFRHEDNIDKNTIVFISGDIKPRSVKIIGALVKKKYNLIVLEYKYCNELVIKELVTYNIKFYHCNSMADVYFKAMQYNPLVYYYEPVWGDCSGVEIMVRHRNLFGKIVFAPYDVLNDGYVQISESDKLTERYCLENADGIVWRWFSKEYLEEKKGFAYKGKSIQFMDYCKDGKTDNNEKTDNKDNKLKICFVQGAINGNLNNAVLDQNGFKNDGIYTETARIDTILNRLGNMDDCIFHIFIGECSTDAEKRLKELERKYSNFKFFCGTAHKELISIISGYDYGCFFMTGGKDIPETESIDNMYYGSNYINSEANRYFDYLDAGIPIIATSPKKQCEYLYSLKVLVKMDVSNLDIGYLKKNKTIYKKNVKEAKTELLIDNQIQRMIDFFHGLY